MRTAILWLAVLGLAAAILPAMAWAQYGGALHSGGWANGMGVPLPPRSLAGVPTPVPLELAPLTRFLAGGTNSYLYIYLNAPLSQARGRIRIVRVSDSVIVGTSNWTSASDNRATVSGLVVGTTYRADVELEALDPAWESVPWTTFIPSYVQPSKNDPPFDWQLHS
ncbi:MAG TPA: hypothetical protein PLL30_17800 [Candidatus Krumholzibacteria bacterium]|nr:hypothetical protein [Candidatus Krumholzibacteria bacterium]HPD73633.1 hypothetical protein [Candidatus Krumholzibacteria bacterium]HRY42057.1 hypothetical protein [Candidatus Krumholzibacteria bacterium]